MTGATARLLADGKRLHLQHGPIDIIAQAFGEERVISNAYGRVTLRFETVLDELCAELPRLRSQNGARLTGRVAQRMAAAVAPYHPEFVTPMAAVAGAVADEVLAVLRAGDGLEKAYVNNGGDAAFWVSAGAEISVLLDDRGEAGRAVIRSCDAPRGVATSGWRGRSHSLGIADAVTVLARTAAAADVAATMIANAVDLPGHPAIERVPAVSLAPDSDLGTRKVTVAVGALEAAEVRAALDAGVQRARNYLDRGLIEDAVLRLNGVSVAARLGEKAILPAAEDVS